MSEERAGDVVVLNGKEYVRMIRVLTTSTNADKWSKVELLGGIQVGSKIIKKGGMFGEGYGEMTWLIPTDKLMEFNKLEV